MSKETVEKMRYIFEPESIAVIGASQDMADFGGWALQRPMTTGYRGMIYPVNPRRDKILGLKCFKSVLDIPGPVDLAVIVVKAQLVPSVMAECVKKGVKAAIIMSSGFAEVGEEGRKLQEETLRIAESGGIKFVGPNCLGVVSASGNLNFFFTQMPRSGSISFVSQSGTLGIYLVNMAASKGYGFNKFISVGNSASLTLSDYMEYLGEDPGTRVIVMYLEGVRDGRRFIEVAREVVKKKPVVVYKGGRSAAGSRAAMSHTASLSGADEVFDAVCRQVGIIRCEECFHPFELAEALMGLPIARGKRISIIGSGGQCLTTSDACSMLGLELPEFDSETKKRLLALLPEHAPVPTNPVDTAATREVLLLPKLLDIILSLDYIDGCIIPGATGGGDTAENIRRLLAEGEGVVEMLKKYNKPLVAYALPGGQQVALNILRRAGIPVYAVPEETARAMWGVMQYGENRRKLEADEKEVGATVPNAVKTH
ncbi:MAG: CoA-binding protein [Chloroflexota bacterium]